MSVQFRILIDGCEIDRPERQGQMDAMVGEICQCLSEHHCPVLLLEQSEPSIPWTAIAEAREMEVLRISRKSGMLLDLADLALVMWDENTEQIHQPQWELIHQCMEHQIPCIWMSTQNGKKYWACQSLYEPYEKQLLEDYSRSLWDDEPWAERVEIGKLAQRFFLSGSKGYSRLLNRVRFEAVSSGHADAMLEDGFHMENRKGERTRRMLAEAYQVYDDRAVHFSRFYRGSIFYRALLPMLSTVMLAFAVYGDASYSAAVLRLLHIPTDVFTAVFFLLHAILIASCYVLAKNRIIQGWHLNFLHNRIIAEVLRFYLHVLPYGVVISPARLLNRSGFRGKQNHGEYARICSLVRQGEEEMPVFSEMNAEEYLGHLSDYLQNQLDYHCASAERYRKLTQMYHRREDVITKLGIGLVIARGILQFVFRMWSGATVYAALVRSLANLAAMIVPALGSYYAGKRALLGLEDSYAVDQAMEERLKKTQKLIQSVQGHLINEVIIQNLTEQIGLLLLGNVFAWEQEMSKKKVKPL